MSASHGAEKLLWVVAIRGVFLMEEGMTLRILKNTEKKRELLYYCQSRGFLLFTKTKASGKRRARTLSLVTLQLMSTLQSI